MPTFPPHKYGRNIFTVVYCHLERRGRWAGRPLAGFILTHWARKHSNEFRVWGCASTWERLEAVGYYWSSLERALLCARETYDIPVRAWIMCDPPAGVKLFHRPKTRYERAHARVRKNMQSILWELQYLPERLRALDLDRP
jgi:hypothetical protein